MDTSLPLEDFKSAHKFTQTYKCTQMHNYTTANFTTSQLCNCIISQLRNSQLDDLTNAHQYTNSLLHITEDKFTPANNCTTATVTGKETATARKSSIGRVKN